MQSPQNILFLCTRLADYMYQCILHLAKNTDFNIIVVRYRPDVNALYEFQNENNLTLIFKDEINFSESWIREINPVVIYSSGWSDGDYRKSIKNFKNIPCVLGLDNPWKGNIRQRVLTYISRFVLKPFFNKVWVAGPEQYSYAMQLGYPSSDIISGVYSADNEKFFISEFKNFDQKVILYVGRLVEYKCADLLASAFNEIQQEDPQFDEWKLVLSGKGPLQDKITSLNNPRIEIKGFVSPENLPKLYSEASIFCLPSKGEHWGVVVHEAALCGLPLLLSDSVSSSNSLLIHGYNGYKFKSGSKNSIKGYLYKLMQSDKEQLKSMGLKSREIALEFSKEKWSAQLLSTIDS